jgi:phosphinothricin acetyltransferase
VRHATIDRARPDDVADLLRLLEQNQLPTAGIRDHLTTALVALEVYPEGALLRSVAVAPALQRRGLGRQLTDAAIRLAQELRVPAMYLLTTTAETFFPKFGFERMARADVPLSVQASVEFTSACPSTATVMRKRLPTFSIRAATIDDLPALTDIYNHYVLNTAITFDKQPFSPEQRRAWFDDHAGSGRYRLLVAIDSDQKRLGYATTSRWRPKAAYDTTVEASVYCHPDAVGRGCGSALYTALFASIGAEDVHTIVAGVALPNPASIRLHERFGFRPVGVFHGVGRKFDKFWDVAWFERPLRT